MATKLYLHDAVSSDTGTLPAATALLASDVGGTVDVTGTGAGTNRTMNTTIGVAQTSSALTTLATTNRQYDWFRRFLSAPLAAQTLNLSTAGDIVLGCGLQQSATNATISLNADLWLWRPSTGAVVQRLAISASNGVNNTGVVSVCAGAAVTTQQWITGTGGSAGASATVADGDILVLEVFNNTIQTSAMAYTVTFFYDGTTEGSTTTAASYLNFPNDTITFSAGAAAVIPDIAMALTVT